jgi:hypothetical protein
MKCDVYCLANGTSVAFVDGDSVDNFNARLAHFLTETTDEIGVRGDVPVGSETHLRDLLAHVQDVHVSDEYSERLLHVVIAALRTRRCMIEHLRLPDVHMHRDEELFSSAFKANKSLLRVSLMHARMETWVDESPSIRYVLVSAGSPGVWTSFARQPCFADSNN